MASGVDALAFGILALLVLGGAVMMLLTRSAVHAAFWLLETMLATAGLFLLLEAEFLALVQVLVWAGAVGMLVFFVAMLTLHSGEDAVPTLGLSVGAGALALSFLFVVYAGIAAQPPRATLLMPDTAPDTLAFGRELFTNWVVPFEIASLVLLVVLVGAVWWSGGGDE